MHLNAFTQYARRTQTRTEPDERFVHTHIHIRTYTVACARVYDVQFSAAPLLAKHAWTHTHVTFATTRTTTQTLARAAYAKCIQMSNAIDAAAAAAAAHRVDAQIDEYAQHELVTMMALIGHRQPLADDDVAVDATIARLVHGEPFVWVVFLWCNDPFRYRICLHVCLCVRWVYTPHDVGMFSIIRMCMHESAASEHNQLTQRCCVRVMCLRVCVSNLRRCSTVEGFVIDLPANEKKQKQNQVRHSYAKQ